MFNHWRSARKMSVPVIASEIGDPGGQIAKWASGARKQIPLRLLVAVSRYTGIPVAMLATPAQLDVVQLASGATRAHESAERL